MSTSTAQGTSQVCTLTYGYTNRRWLGALGHINGLQYDHIYPGGPNGMSLTIAQPPTWRTDAIDPGRITEIWRGGSRIWEGILDEGVPDTSGWSVTAHGAGTYATSYDAHYATWNIDNPLDLAIGRGMRWTKPTFGSIGWLQQVADDASTTCTDFLNNATIQAGLLWSVDSRQGNLLSIGAPPDDILGVDRLLVCTVPNPRTLAAAVNTLWCNYVSAVDTDSGDQTVTVTMIQNAAAALKYGNQEDYVDLSAAGLMTSGAVTTNITNVLNQYIRAMFTSTYTVRHGQYMTTGGSAVDLGSETAYPHVARLLLTDGSYGGEVVATPVSFVVGQFAFDQDSETAQVTPYQSYKTDIQTLITAAIPALRQ